VRFKRSTETVSGIFGLSFIIRLILFYSRLHLKKLRKLQRSLLWRAVWWNHPTLISLPGSQLKTRGSW